VAGKGYERKGGEGRTGKTAGKARPTTGQSQVFKNESLTLYELKSVKMKKGSKNRETF